MTEDLVIRGITKELFQNLFLLNSKNPIFLLWIFGGKAGRIVGSSGSKAKVH